MTLLHHAQTDIGRQRTNNEDTFVNLASADQRHLLLGAIDGMGGYEGGEVAASIYRQSLETSFRLTEAQGFSPATADNLEDLRQWAITGNNSIVQAAQTQSERPHMGCVATIALIDVQAERLYYAHVGDSRGYIFRRGELIKFTHDHSPVGRLEDSGALLEPEAMRHPRRHQIDRHLGQTLLSATDTTHVEVGSHSFYAGDIVLLCSDGLTDLVDRATLTALLSQDIALPTLAQQLIDHANALGGKDNITVALASLPAQHSTSIRPEDKSLIVEEVVVATSANDKPKRRAKSQAQPSAKLAKAGAGTPHSPTAEAPESVSEHSRFYSGLLMLACLGIGLALGTLYGQNVLAWLTPSTATEPIVSATAPALPADSLANDSIANDSILNADSVLISAQEKAEYDNLKRTQRPMP